MTIGLALLAGYLLPEPEMKPQKQVDMSANDSVYATLAANPWYAPAGLDRARVDMVSRCAPTVDVDAELQYFQEKMMKSLPVPEAYTLAPDSTKATCTTVSGDFLTVNVVGGDLVASCGYGATEWVSPETLALRAENKELKDKLAQAEAAYYCAYRERDHLEAQLIQSWAEEGLRAIDAYRTAVDIEIEADPMTAYERAMKVL